jgi:hypothetical protein
MRSSASSPASPQFPLRHLVDKRADQQPIDGPSIRSKWQEEALICVARASEPEHVPIEGGGCHDDSFLVVTDHHVGVVSRPQIGQVHAVTAATAAAPHARSPNAIHEARRRPG